MVGTSTYVNINMEYHCNCFSAFQTRRVPGAILVYRTSWRPLPLAWRSCSKTFSQVPPKSLARPWFTQVGILGWCSSHDTLLQIRISSRGGQCSIHSPEPESLEALESSHDSPDSQEGGVVLVAVAVRGAPAPIAMTRCGRFVSTRCEP